MKRIQKTGISLLLALLLALSLFVTSGCDSSVPPSDPQGQTSNGSQDGGGSGSSDLPADPSCAHVDQNDDGACDLCRGSVIVVLDLFAINDLHGKIFDSDSQPGVDELTTYLKKAYAEEENVILLSSGDMWQGSSESNLTHGAIMTEWMNELDFASMTLGNHEFDWDTSYISANLALAEFPLLAINIYETSTNKRADYAAPSVIVERGGAKIGIIGAIGNCYSSISQDKVVGVEFKLGSELTALVKAESERLRSAGCDTVVYSIHDGLTLSGDNKTATASQMSSYYDVALSDGYIDLVFEAHTHHDYVAKDQHGVYHVQGGGENSAISHVEMNINIARDEASVNSASTIDKSVYDDCADDPIVNALAQKYAADIAKADEVIGTINQTLNGNALRQICADMYLSVGLEKWGSKYNIFLGGGYFSVRSPGKLNAGTVYYKDLYTLFPFDNPLYLCSVSGSKLRSQFTETSNSNYFVSLSEYGVSQTIDPNGTYYIIADAYSAFYKNNGLTIIEQYDSVTFSRDLLADYIREGQSDASDSVLASGTGFITVGEAIEIANSIPKGNYTNDKYYLIATIVDEPNERYGNCMVRDLEGNEIQVWGIYGKDSTQYKDLASKPKKGDTVILYSCIMRYYNENSGAEKPELYEATLIDFVATSTFSEIQSIGSGLPAQGVTSDTYTVIATVDSVYNEKYGNMYVEDENGETLTIYGVVDNFGNLYNAMSKKPLAGDTVVLRGPIKKYVNNSGEITIEFEDAIPLYIIRNGKLV